VPGGRPNAEPGGGRASGAVRRRLDTKPRFIRRLIAERRIEYHKVGRHVRISESALAEFIAAGKVPPLTSAGLWPKLKGVA
jgi:excisionase family DNA binding protein